MRVVIYWFSPTTTPKPALDWLERIEASFADPSVGAVGGRDWLQYPMSPLYFSQLQFHGLAF